MTLKDFYKVHKKNDTITITTMNNEHIFNPRFFTWAELFNIVNGDTIIKHFDIDFSYDGEFRGFLIYVSKEDYKKIKEIYNKNT